MIKSLEQGQNVFAQIGGGEIVGVFDTALNPP